MAINHKQYALRLLQMMNRKLPRGPLLHHEPTSLRDFRKTGRWNFRHDNGIWPKSIQRSIVDTLLGATNAPYHRIDDSIRSILFIPEHLGIKTITYCVLCKIIDTMIGTFEEFRTMRFLYGNLDVAKNVIAALNEDDALMYRMSNGIVAFRLLTNRQKDIERQIRSNTTSIANTQQLLLECHCRIANLGESDSDRQGCGRCEQLIHVCSNKHKQTADLEVERGQIKQKMIDAECATAIGWLDEYAKEHRDTLADQAAKHIFKMLVCPQKIQQMNVKTMRELENVMAVERLDAYLIYGLAHTGIAMALWYEWGKRVVKAAWAKNVPGRDGLTPTVGFGAYYGDTEAKWIPDKPDIRVASYLYGSPTETAATQAAAIGTLLNIDSCKALKEVRNEAILRWANG